MTIAVMEVYDALKSAGVEDGPARRAAEAMGSTSKVEGRVDAIDARLGRVEARLDAVDGRLAKIEADAALLKWMAGGNIGLTLLVLGKLLVP